MGQSVSTYSSSLLPLHAYLKIINRVKYILIILLISVICACNDKKKREFRYFQNYQRTFNDLNHRHLKAAKQWGIKPIISEEDMESRLSEMEEIESCRYYEVDKLTHSLPYLVPRAENLLKTIGRNFRDSLDAKDLPSRKIIVTSVLRTAGTVKKLRQKNINASANSAHVYGTTFDIAYARYKGAKKEETDKLKSVLAEVLRDLRRLEKCYVRYEYKQGCFHVTVR